MRIKSRKKGKNEIEIIDEIIKESPIKTEEKPILKRSTHKMKIDQNKSLEIQPDPSKIKTSNDIRISQEYEKMLELTYEDFSDKEEILKERAAKVVHLKKQYEEYEDSKKQLEKFVEEGKNDLDKTREQKYKELIEKTEKKKNELGFHINWHPLNEKVTKQIVQLRKEWGMNQRDTKAWFYIIRREEIAIKKAQELM